ncbi:unnamed protein product [Acanthoscelides obtectus]|uniref:AAA-ATPase-like domain-containing protein n=1 Tax=Acanthoscelides obtectus TaxID=200917 RepID=A0A9P0P794_ACAOB|nr:unnamed protein product [Acanthoscelides obtectus]CAK1682968.1 hypothetical protein AOBTE_LOCUS34023 [Acanthoscelides obtectus]
MFEDEIQGGPKFHLGVSDFSKLVRTKAFVDKSLLIKEFLEDDFVLITAPRQFGKSTNMDMLKKFLEIAVDGRGEPMSDTQTTFNCNLFKEHNLRIFQDSAFFTTYCGQYPVIYANFSRATGDTFQSIIDEFRHIIQDAFEEHEYLLCSQRLNKIQIENFTYYYSNYRTLTEAEIISSLYVLCKCLRKHFQRNVVVLIDGCDTPILDGIHRNINENDIEIIVSFIRKLMTQLLKGNSYVHHGMINARSHFAKVLLEDCPNILHYPFLGNHRFSKYYGFSNKEVKHLLDQFGLIDKFKEVSDWYDGYRVVGQYDISMFNTWSILNFLKFRTPKDYWADLNTIKNLEQILKVPAIQEKVNKLLLGEEVCIYKPESVTIQHIKHLTHLYNKPLEAQDSVDVGLFFELSFDNGYFSIIRTSCTYLVLGIPNCEIENYFKRVLHKNVLRKRWGSIERL